MNKPDHAFDIKKLLLSLDPYPHVRAAAIYDANWRQQELYLGQASIDADKRVHQPDMSAVASLGEGIHKQGDDLISIQLIGDPGYLNGYLVIVNDLQGPLTDSTHNLFLHVLPAALVLLLLVALAYYFIGNWWLSPLTRLSLFAQQVEKTKDYSLELPEAGQFEVAALTDNINAMMRVIREESEVNAEYVTLLEERRAEMEYMANYDVLTGLANRSRFRKLVDAAMARLDEHHRHVAIMYVDLDGFKVVNDALGHEVGDRLLELVAQRLQAIVPEDSTISRHGGDEFLVMIENCPDRSKLESLADMMVMGLMQKYLISTWEVRVSASIGIATTFDSGADGRNLIRNADVAMFNAKSLGKSRYCFFSSEMMIRHQRRLDIANFIEAGLKDGEFTVFYQQKNRADGSRVGAEALVRWNSKQLGFVSPAEFIPIAEQSGKISEITQWVVERVCADCRDVFQYVPGPFRVSINLSANDLKKFHMIGFIKGAFIKYGLPRGLVEFEVTEYSYLDNLDVANRFFREITAMGCKVSLDDFGTGYSSLSYLTKIPIDVIKIDKQFVDNIGLSPRDDALVVTIIDMARRLGMDLCAEGVETAEQCQFLHRHGCETFQGYLFHKPMTLADFRVVLGADGQKPA
ncbi:putative bifunctional diguanylate cyclase/phosphodiesterase [Oceanobacter mangrovi]|uniref:putative bifunctional diguanylate cyclase/phosphodiesterase n=1 Tax=Oceanobacter mangrovi TaxID=2862510 RepID=UPI001C8EAD98